MSDLDELANSFRAVLDNSDFLVELRISGRFQENVFNELLRILREYAQASHRQTMIHKSIAQDAFDLLVDIGANLYYSRINGSSKEEVFEAAYSELLELLPLVYHIQRDHPHK